MDAIILENFRCFRARWEVPLAPLTLLVGENSTGKTSFLAAVRTAFDIYRGRQDPEFNEVPFELGAYEQIANTRTADGGHAKRFSIGSSFERAPVESHPGIEIPLMRRMLSEKVTFVGSFADVGGQPKLCSYHISVGGYRIDEKIELDTGRRKFVIEGMGSGVKVAKRFTRSESDLSILQALAWFAKVASGRTEGKTDIAFGDNDVIRADFEGIIDVLLWVEQFPARRPISIAPIRSRPKRTYDPISETPTPEGRHVPMVLARMSALEPEEWDSLRVRLADYGQKSGLFERIDVRRKGRKIIDPFHLLVRTSGPAMNLLDVGYGVSQVLPILVDAILGKKGQTILMQQPEVHLHPQAQAELGSFLGFLAKKEKKRFVIETHSDYLIDRVRMDVRDGKGGLTPKDVQILYFERKGAEVQIHPIEIDANGNILGAPKGYRKFFLDEEKRSLGF